MSHLKIAVTELVSCGLTLPSKRFVHDEVFCHRRATPRRNKMPRHNQCVCVGTVTMPKKKILWRVDLSPGHDLPLRGFAITLIGHTTLSVTPLDE